MFKVWKAFYSNRLERSNERFIDKIAQNRHKKAMQKRILESFRQHSKQHQGHGVDNSKAIKFLKKKFVHKFLLHWSEQTRTQLTQRSQIEKVEAALEKAKLRDIVGKWKHYILKGHMKLAQLNTANHVCRQKYVRKALLAIKCHSKHLQRRRTQFRMVLTHDVFRQLSKAFKGLCLNWKCNVMKAQKETLADKFRTKQLKTVAMREMQYFRNKKMHTVKLNTASLNYYAVALEKSAFEGLMSYALYSKEHKA